jgi:hypothetical protein
MDGIGATHIDHIVISSNNSEVVAETFRRNLGIEIRRTMSRPGTGARLAFAKLGDVILEFAGPPSPTPPPKSKRASGAWFSPSPISPPPSNGCAASATTSPTRAPLSSPARSLPR